MKKVVILLFVLFSLALWSSLSNAHEARIAQSHELSADRPPNQKARKDLHSHDVKPKSKYDLRDLDGDRRGDTHKHVHKHGHNHDHKAKSKYDLMNVDGQDHREAHGHDHGHAYKHDHGDAHKHKHGAAHVHDHGDNPDSHDDHGHEGHGREHGHGGHDHGYDRLWHVGVSG